MKKILIIFLAIFLSFAGISSIRASEKLIKTETKDRVMFIQDKNGEFLYSWSFDKNKYNKSDLEFDMTINFESPNEDKINNLISSDIIKEYISFNYHGILPTTATIKVPVNNFNDGERLKLYYYDEDTNEIELVDDNVLVKNGYVSFEIDHCSDYFLTLSIVNEASNTNNNGMLIIGMLIIIVGLIGYTIFKNRK